MATLTNNEKVLRGLDLLQEGILPWVDLRMSMHAPAGSDWLELWAAAENAKFGTAKTYSKDDVRVLLRVVTERWQVFKDDLERPQSALATELRDTANRAHHGEKFSSDDTYRALDSIERLLTAIGAADEADAVATLRTEHQREVYEKQARNRAAKVTPLAVAGTVAGVTVKPWRDVVTPHPDVMKGQFSSAEFAADLHQVATGQSTSPEYADPREFFARTFITSGLQDLLERALRRISGDGGASPVVNLQTQFGGGKTHSMLALYHLFSGIESRSLPAATQDVVGHVLTATDGPDPLAALTVRRVALVGTRLSPGQPAPKPDGTTVRTLWGELAWQLGEAGGAGGGAATYARVAEADANGVPPGTALDELVREIVDGGERILLLVDEWVAYARLLVDAPAPLPGGTFEGQFTFAQHLTELAKSTPGVMLVVSIPDSETIDTGGGGSALEVGGPKGRVALDMLQQVIGRNADDWRPATGLESFEIVRRRLFQEPDATALADIAAVAKQYVKYYQENTGFFPKDVAQPAYEARIKAAYPIHPELFDRLYEDWSALPKFQRTRGVLRLMSQVISALWNAGDTAPLITPGIVPVSSPDVYSEITHYLDDNWRPIIDKDVDGPGSTPVVIDGERPAFGARHLTRRVARTVFMATVPTLRTQHVGVDVRRLRLGAAVPGDVMSHLGDARELLSQRATYFYEDGDRSWYDTAASSTRLAAEKAAGYSEEDVYAAIVDRLRFEPKKSRGLFDSVHAAPEDTGDVPDGDPLRLVLVHPRRTWAKDASQATEFADEALNRAGSGQRQRKNRVVFLAADRGRFGDLEGAVREHLGWEFVVGRAEELGLSLQQKNQATKRAGDLDLMVDARLRAAYTALLTPVGQPGQKITLSFDRLADGSTSMADRVTTKLKSVGKLTDVYGTELVRIALDGPLASAWTGGHVEFGTLWTWYAQYPYLQRLSTRRVLEQAVLAVADSVTWNTRGFALAAGYDEASDRYVDLWIPGDQPEPQSIPDPWLIVRLERAVAQRAADARAGSGTSTDGVPGGVSPVPPSGGGEAGGQGGGAVGPQPPTPPRVAVKRRFYGSKALDPVSYVRDWNLLRDEIFSALTATDGTALRITVEIEAENADGFPEGTIRTVSENGTVLGLDQQGFEER
ncbi:Swt1 family HEPN domain-containing protein [Cellulosimicrobium sp. ES-005]|uniref:Swt1 family HEPN domain-containing protein n=1 Tax=Cellulosimicrobium sp. ES-005 TaxID=3163031 RepID=A0AAU8G585_9MICO